MIVIGEKINATRKSVKEALRGDDLDFLQRLCREQETSGADYIDVNVGTGEDVENEAAAMQWLVKALEEVTDKPLCIDSADPVVIEAGVNACSRATPMINSINGSDSKMESIVPIAARHGARMIALAMDEGGIPASAEDRIGVCRRILERSTEMGVSEDHIFFDPLALPLSTGEQQARVTLDTLSGLKQQAPAAKTVIGLSNVSFGLPRRPLINAAFLIMAIGAGLDAVILDPTDAKLVSLMRAAEVVAGKDRRCRRYIRAHNSGQLTD